MSYLREEARAFAERIKAMGFQVYMAKRGTYGFITDDTETRVLSFTFEVPANLSGNYWPASSQSGTGWRMDASPYDLRTKDDVRMALYATPPDWVRGRGWKTMTTVAQHLGVYASSSHYERV